LQNSSLDFLIPKSVLDLAQLDRFELQLELQGTPANDRWPTVCVWGNNEVIWIGKVDPCAEIFYTTTLDTQASSYDLRIEYFGKQDNDTIVDNQGQIVENQSVKISKLVLNGIDVIGIQSVYQLGKYYMHLGPEKIKAFQDMGLSTEPNHSLHMFENGEWKLQIPVPVVSGLASFQSLYEKHEVWIEPQEEVYKKIYAKILNIRNLQQKIKEIKCNSNSKL